MSLSHGTYGSWNKSIPEVTVPLRGWITWCLLTILITNPEGNFVGGHLGEIDKSKYTTRKSSLPVDRCFVVMGANGHVACGAAETHTNMKTGKKRKSG